MSSLSWFFFESLPALGAALFLVNFALLVHWRRQGRPRPLLIGLSVAVVLLVVQQFVVTRREHAAAILGAIETELPASRTAALGRSLARDFACEGMDRDEFLELAQQRLAAIKIVEIRRTALEVDDAAGAAGGGARGDATATNSESFAVLASYLTDVDTRDIARGWIKSRWRICFVRESDAWRIVGIEVLELNNTPMTSIRNVRP